MPRKSYSEQLKDPRWQKKRLEIFERDGWKCVRCHRTDLTLHIHHSYYKRTIEPWDYPNDSLSTLCEICHEHQHGLKGDSETRASMNLALLGCVKGRGRCEEVLAQCTWRLDPFEDDPEIFDITIICPTSIQKLADMEIDEKVMTRFLWSAQRICNRVNGSRLVFGEIHPNSPRIGDSRPVSQEQGAALFKKIREKLTR